MNYFKLYFLLSLFLVFIVIFSGCVTNNQLNQDIVVKSNLGCDYNNSVCDWNQKKISDLTNITQVNQSTDTIISSNKPKKFLTVIAISEAGGQDYNSNSWAGVLNIRDDNNIQIFDVVMWDNGNSGNPSIISVYKFDETFNSSILNYFNTIDESGQAWVDYREKFNILNVNVPKHQENMPYDSNAYLNAFKLIIKTIIENQPAEHYGIKYLGHGSGDGSIFGYRIWQPEAESLFAYTNLLIGKKLDFIDWSYNCAMGTYQVVKSQYKYTDYIIASDILRGGFDIDWANDYYKLKLDGAFNTFFSKSKTIRQSLIDMLNSERQLWETITTKDYMVLNKVKQSLSIYDTSKFEDLMNSTNLNQNIQSGEDILNYIKTNYPTQEQKFYDFRFYYINNKDFFQWDINYNGFRMQ